MALKMAMMPITTISSIGVKPRCFSSCLARPSWLAPGGKRGRNGQAAKGKMGRRILNFAALHYTATLLRGATVFYRITTRICGRVIYRPDGAAPSGGRISKNAWKIEARTCLVSAPTEMKSTGFSKFVRFSAVTLPDTSSRAAVDAFHRLAHLVGVEIIQHDNIAPAFGASSVHRIFDLDFYRHVRM